MRLLFYWISLYAGAYDLDPKLVYSVIQVESSWNANAVGNHGEVGLMQVVPKYVPIPREKLFDPRQNVHYGIRALASAKARCKHKERNTFLLCFNRGIVGGSRVENPYEDAYYKKVMVEYKRRYADKY
jgi:soluble lytic murein transglycosylase-like protein